MYRFKITYLKDGVLETHIEEKRFLNQGSAYLHFDHLCDKYDVGPYYYLCSWKEV